MTSDEKIEHNGTQRPALWHVVPAAPQDERPHQTFGDVVVPQKIENDAPPHEPAPPIATDVTSAAIATIHEPAQPIPQPSIQEILVLRESPAVIRGEHEPLPLRRIFWVGFQSLLVILICVAGSTIAVLGPPAIDHHSGHQPFRHYVIAAGAGIER